MRTTSLIYTNYEFHCLFDLINLYTSMINIDNINIILLLISLAHNFIFNNI